MKLSRSITAPVWFGCFLISATSAASGAGLQAGAPADVVVTLHEPVIAELVFSNTAGTAVDADSGQSSESKYDIAIMRPNGQTVKAGMPYWATFPDTISEIQTTRIEPGQSFQRPVLLNQWFPFDEVGGYHVSVNVPGVEGAASFWVVISPRDEPRLSAVCESLVKDAISLDSPRRLEAGLTLSFVSDDLAISYLMRAASDPAVNSGFAFEGLARIDDTQAVAALASLLHQSDDQIRREASGYLGRMLRSGNDQVRRAVTSALNDPSGR